MSKTHITRFQGVHYVTAAPPWSWRMCGTHYHIISSIYYQPLTTASITARLPPSDCPQLSDQWFALRKDKLTASTFSTVLGFWKGKRRAELWHEKVFGSAESTNSSTSAMNWGLLNEAAAKERYTSITGHDVSSLGLVVHTDEQFSWLGASPDGLLGGSPGGGILEVKCPYNKGKTDEALPWAIVPFYYMPQLQGLMEIMDREWVDLFCWTRNGSTLFRVGRERAYWKLIHGILKEFWWENVVPAREAILAGKEEDAMLHRPASTHRMTGLVIVRSLKLAAEVRLLCRETAGHTEFTDSYQS